MPLLFEIYDRGRRLTDFRVRAASAVGPESIPMAGRVSFEAGLLRVDVGGELDSTRALGYGDPGDDTGAYADLPVASAAAVSLLWNAGPGEYLLETTRLPPREEPYILNVELARHRLMRLMQKQEDWNLWEVPAAAAAVQQARKAQQVFAEALSVLHDPPAAAQKADEALDIALEAGEALATVHGELLLGRRRRAGLPRTLFGVRADSSNSAPRNAGYRATLARGFDCVSVPMSWRQMQPEEELFDTGGVDATVEFLAKNRVPMVAGPLVDLSGGEVPEWLFIYEHEFETLRDLAFEYVRSAVTRYRRVVKLWNVVAGLHASGNFGLTFEQMIELTRLLVGQVKAVLPTAKTLVTVRQPFGEYLADSVDGSIGASTAVPPMLYAEMVSQSGVQVDGFGVEILMGVPRRGRYCRDLFQISAMLDRFASLGKPLFVTTVACPDRSEAAASAAGRLAPGEAGRWHEGWSPRMQANWLREVLKLALSKPYVENVAWANLADSDACALPGSGLLDDSFQPKPAFEALSDLRARLRPSVRGVKA